MKKATNVISVLGDIALYLCMGVIGLMMLLTVADVTMRYVFIKPITGTIELIQMCMVCTLLAMAPCALQRSHITVDMFVNKMSLRGQQVMDVCTLLVSLALVVLLAWQSWENALWILERGVTSSQLNVPDFPVHVVLVLSYVVLLVAIVFLIIQQIMELKRK